MNAQQNNGTGKGPPRVKRTVLAATILGLFASAVGLAYWVFPTGLAPMNALEVDPPLAVMVAGQVATYIHLYLVPIGLGCVFCAGVAWLGLFDWALKPLIALSLLALLAMGAAAFASWNTMDKVADAFRAMPG